MSSYKFTRNWVQSFTYDPWGNLKNVSVTRCSAPTFSAATVLANNQLSGYSYDAAGNMIQNGSVTYSYDAESRMSSTQGVTYTYDAAGQRIARNGSGIVDTQYVYGPGGEVLAETDGGGTLLREYIYFGGKRVARRDASTGAVHYYLADQLGSSDVVASAAGAIEEDSEFYPFGGERVYTDSLSDQNYKFTGKERDTETGLDYFGARYYASTMGRFMSPDWSSAADPVPYADMTDPQTLNLYVYVQNNPLSQADVDGHCPCASELADYLDSKINSAVSYVQNKAVSSGSPTLAATTTFLAGSTGDVGKGFTNLLRTGESVGSLPSGASGAQIATVVAEEGGRVGGTIIVVVAAAGPRTPASAESGAKVAGDVGKNRVTLDNGSQVDVAGRAHFEKSTQQSVATPHIKDATVHTGPSGQSSVTYGPTRPATVGDVNAAARAAGTRPPVRIPPPLPVPRKENH